MIDFILNSLIVIGAGILFAVALVDVNAVDPRHYAARRRARSAGVAA
jgi:hypothetical protein